MHHFEAIEAQMNKAVDYEQSSIKVSQAGYDIEVEGDKFKHFIED